MGVDWYRAKISNAAGPAKVDELIERQAIAFQSMWGWISIACSDYNGVESALLERLHEPAYLAASKALRALIAFPEWDEESGRPTDVPDLEICWRVYPITHNPIYPPLWRVRAHRTFLPGELPHQIRQWRKWAAQAASGEHDDYIQELHLQATSDFMHYHWSYLRGNATASLGEDGDWARKPALVEVREKILRLGEPAVASARIDPADKRPDDLESIGGRLRTLFGDLAVLLDLTRAWNSLVRGNWKLPDYTDSYSLTLDAFKEHARDPWLLDFLRWADECAESGFALFLDY